MVIPSVIAVAYATSVYYQTAFDLQIQSCKQLIEYAAKENIYDGVIYLLHVCNIEIEDSNLNLVVIFGVSVIGICVMYLMN